MSGLTCVVLEGSMETHSDDTTCLMSAEISMSDTEEKGKLVGGKKTSIVHPVDDFSIHKFL